MYFKTKKFKEELKTNVEIQQAIANIKNSEVLYNEEFLNKFSNDKIFDEVQKEYFRYSYNDNDFNTLSFLERNLFSPLNLLGDHLGLNLPLEKVQGNTYKKTNSKKYEELLSLIIDVFSLTPISKNFVFSYSLKKYIIMDSYYINNNGLFSFGGFIKSSGKTMGNIGGLTINGRFHSRLEKDYLILYNLIHSCIPKDKVIKNTSPLYMLKEPNGKFDLSTFNVKNKIVDIENDYNDDFKCINDKIENMDIDLTGLIMFYGDPGTGKTSYLNYLLNKNKDKRKVIYIPSMYLTSLNDARFHELLNQNKNSIIVLEDSEEALLSRDSSRNSLIQTLLNFSDGLMAEIFKPVFICTFNTDITKIDQALLRKGRCIAKYEFKALKADKAQKLNERLGFDTVITEDTKLADIYNQEENDFSKAKKESVGFKFQKSA